VELRAPDRRRHRRSPEEGEKRSDGGAAAEWRASVGSCGAGAAHGRGVVPDGTTGTGLYWGTKGGRGGPTGVSEWRSSSWTWSVEERHQVHHAASLVDPHVIFFFYLDPHVIDVKGIAVYARGPGVRGWWTPVGKTGTAVVKHCPWVHT
jgi:hypothetical protein